MGVISYRIFCEAGITFDLLTFPKWEQVRSLEIHHLKLKVKSKDKI